MLLQFSVENYKSIKEKAYLSLIPSTNKEHPNNIASIGKYSALKSAAIYGANASGKTNLIEAMATAALIIATSETRPVAAEIPHIHPFKFDENTVDKPSSFEFIFIADDNIKYVYGFSADRNKVHEEYLYYYLSSTASTIFERTDNQIDCPQKEKHALDPLKERNTPNKLFISTATTWNYKKTYIPYMWLIRSLSVLSDFHPLLPISLNRLADDQDGSLKKFTINLLHHADINIDDYEIDAIDQKDEPNAFLLTSLLKNALPNAQVTPSKTFRVTTAHKVSNIKYQLNLSEESKGTRQLFTLSPFLKEVFEHGKTLVVDELDASLHSFLVQYLVDLFHDPEINSKNAQLVFSTHDTNLLSLDTFRRDQIYFVEKNIETAESSVYSLDEFSVRKVENIERGYLLGRYGAIPFLQTGGNLWE